MGFLLALLPLICGPVSAAGFHYEDLVRLIKDQHLTSIEAVLPVLPSSLRSNYTLMHDSKSLQEGLVVSPRAILFGEDGSFACTFNGDAGQFGYDTLECVQFRKRERKFEFRQIQFPSSKNKLRDVAFSDENQSADGKISCTLCHGSDPRLNWNGYPQWDGAFGESYDDVSPDKDHYGDFVKIRDSDPRYKWLIQGTAPNDPYLWDPYLGPVTIDHRPNLRFSDLAGRMNALRAERLLHAKVAVWGRAGVRGSRLELSGFESGARAIQRERLELRCGLDPGRIFAKVNLPCFEWSTTVYNATDEIRCGKPDEPEYEHQSGIGLLSLDVAMVTVNDLASSGNRPLKHAVKKIVKDHGPLSTDYNPFLMTLNSIFPSVVRHESRYKSEVDAICPELTRIFEQEYLKSSKH